MKTVRFATSAVNSPRRHGNRADLTVAKIEAYAADPASVANNVTHLKGSRRLRMRIGDFRVILEESATVITIIDIGPRGAIYR